MLVKVWRYCLWVCIFPIGCTNNSDSHLFKYVSLTHSNIKFSNTITEDEVINVVNFQYCYNGGGVGISDFNNDGLPDIVFTGNQVSVRLYLNRGNLKFEDISEKASFKTTAWVTGVSIIDINEDGFDDVYLNVGGVNCNNNCHNLLFVNKGIDEKGIPSFEEMAEEYGLNDGHYSQQSLFFDFDNDGDLDVYIVHNGNTIYDKNAPVLKAHHPTHLKDFLLRNDWDEKLKHSFFTNVSGAMGIDEIGFGLGVGLNDFNEDGLPDIYVSNDFLTDDFLYVNKGTDHKTGLHQGFSQESNTYLAHQTYNAMGVDIADINNDFRPDILVVDMLPMNHIRQKKMLGSINYDKYIMGIKNGYAPQYIHNSLQINNGFIGSQPIMYSEVGFLSGVSSTDWSWAPLIMDYDNNGNKDIFITNGYVKDITDLDFINYSNQNIMFGNATSQKQQYKRLIDKLPGVTLNNFFYQNKNNNTFNDVSTAWAKEKKSFSNGVAYADLDLDGDLDLVVNNINEEAFLMENTVMQKSKKSYLRVKLNGGKNNKYAIGSKVIIWSEGNKQIQYHSIVRGYLSSVEPIIHFGLKSKKVDSLLVKWPNGQQTKINNVKVNQVLSINMDESANYTVEKKNKDLLFKQDKKLLSYKHIENPFNDYAYQPLLVRQYSRVGPSVSVANIDNQPGDEIFIGGSVGNPGQIWFQNKSGEYYPKQTLDAKFEDAASVFVDIDGDNDLDLYVASGGNEFASNASEYEDRVYINDGHGHFEKNESIIPKSLQSSSCVKASDIDKDGDLDLFVGGRLVPWSYPNIPKSRLLINNGGSFAEKQGDIFSSIGMVTDAIWKDINKDGWNDLIIVGEWMPIRVFKNNKGVLEEIPLSIVNEQNEEISTEGWWNVIKSGDFDNDGDEDFVIGNQGLNGFIKPQGNSPVHLYKKDFDLNGRPDPVLAQSIKTSKGEHLFPIQSRDDLMKQMISLKSKYPTYEKFAKTDFITLLNIKDLNKETLKGNIFYSSYLINMGDWKFKLVPLPLPCQVAPINAILVDDFDSDSILDVLIAGNDYTSEPHYGRYDALTGLLLRADKGDSFIVYPSRETGFYSPGQTSTIKRIKDRNNNIYYIVFSNDGKAKVYYY